ncbi:hypothetical protein WOB59_22385 [Methylocystis sp. IM4]|uniref:hypothetical protein n=1 Tax=Methylocystis sp. IM4 TaxID=3136560 RepID=UPI0031198993
MEVILRKELVQIVAGHSSRDARVFLPDVVARTIDQRFEFGVKIAFTTTCPDDALKLIPRRPTDRHAFAVIGQDFKLAGVIDCFSAHDGMSPATVVADHSTEGAIFELLPVSWTPS